MRAPVMFLVLLMLASNAFAVCVGNVTCPNGNACFSAPASIALFPGLPCNPPLQAFNVALVCNDRLLGALAQCCSCRRCDVKSINANTVEITIQSAEGLTSIKPTILQNATLSPPPADSFAVGSTDIIVLTGTKIDPALRSRIELEVCDSNCIRCDPVLTLVVREAGKPVSDAISQLPQAEGFVTISNGSPGLRTLHVTANGRKFKMAGLKDGEERTLDVSAGMMPGEENIIILSGTGKPGGNATILIHD